MPGVGVTPGLAGLPSVLGSGMPGVGVVPFAGEFTAFAAGIPGAELLAGRKRTSRKPWRQVVRIYILHAGIAHVYIHVRRVRIGLRCRAAAGQHQQDRKTSERH